MANLLPYFNENLPVIYFVRLFCAELNLFPIPMEHYSQTLVQLKFWGFYERVVLEDKT